MINELVMETIMELLKVLLKVQGFADSVLGIIKNFSSDETKAFNPGIVYTVVSLYKELEIPIHKITNTFYSLPVLLNPEYLFKMKKGLLATVITSPKIHPIWKFLVMEISKNPASISDFCSIILSDFFDTTTDQKIKLMGFTITRLLLNVLEPKFIEHIFTKKFLTCLITSSNSLNSLYKPAKNLFKSIRKIIQHDPLSMIAVIIKLDQPESKSHNFDLLSKTHIVSNILKSLSVEGASMFTNRLFQMFWESDNRTENLKSWVIDQLFSLIKVIDEFLDAKST